MRLVLVRIVLIILGAYATCIAQPVIDTGYFPHKSPDYSPWIVETYPDSLVSRIPPSMGLNQAWSYFVGAHAVSDRQFFADSTSFDASSQDISIEEQVPGGYNNTTQYRITDSGMVYRGTAVVRGSITHIPGSSVSPEVLSLPIGFSYGQTFTRQMMEEDYRFNTIAHLTYTCSYVGAGSLIAATYYWPQVSLLRVIRYRKYLTSSGIQADTVYQWRANGFGIPIMEITLGSVRDSTRNLFGLYTSNSVVRSQLTSSYPSRKDAFSIQLFPMPAGKAVTVQLSNKEDVAPPCLIRTLDGRVMQRFLLENKVVSVEGLPPGLYTLEVQGRTQAYRARLVKE